ncbi:unnamed protein product [Mesocestoides corti]|uniref:Uncharacterized protein n=1 Tax=Mesocestoides corti TaxID=53468 RepID=A0A0R3U3S1_MESCO|nr:unnamed protein product [Mesocestoides corti]
MPQVFTPDRSASKTSKYPSKWVMFKPQSHWCTQRNTRAKSCRAVSSIGGIGLARGRRAWLWLACDADGDDAARSHMRRITSPMTLPALGQCQQPMLNDVAFNH